MRSGMKMESRVLDNGIGLRESSPAVRPLHRRLTGGCCGGVGLLMVLLAAGCGADPAEKQNLSAGYTALDTHQYDEAIRRADEQLQQHKDDEGTAEALYLKGRAYEQRAKPMGPQAGGDMATAAGLYQQALTLSPAPKLEGFIHTSLGNVQYWRDDYASALQQFSSAYDLLETADLKSFVLYRAGLCQQRLGRFDLADQSFAAVQSRFPGSDAAKRSHDHLGYRNFTVRLATYRTFQEAQASVATLQREGVTPARATDAQGHSVISLGPVTTYAQAESLKTRFSGQYPDAMILP